MHLLISKVNVTQDSCPKAGNLLAAFSNRYHSITIGFLRSASVVLEPSFLIFQKIESSRSEQVSNKSLNKICIIVILEIRSH